MGELNKIFDRSFVVGHFTPALIFGIASFALVWGYNIAPGWLVLQRDDLLKDATAIALVTLGAGICLQALNRELFRLLEGYCWPKLRNWLAFVQRQQFRRLRAQVDELRRELAQCQREGTEFTRENELMNKMIRAAKRFPASESMVLPTAFGNTVRAAEDYSRAIYGFESIEGWSRMHGVISKEFSLMLDASRAKIDFWLNLWFLSWLVILEYLIISYVNGFKNFWIPIVIVLFALMAAGRARDAAERWGEWIKAAFDIYRPELCKKLGYSLPATRQAERRLWLRLSEGIVYSYPKSFDLLEEFREKPAEPSLTLRAEQFGIRAEVLTTETLPDVEEGH
jgi:hypothetical protein